MCSVPQITVLDLARLQDEHAVFFLLDIREIHEVETSHIKHAVHIPMALCLSRHNEIPRDAPVVVYCRTGARSSAIVSALMTKYDFTNLRSLKGGMTEWSRSIEPNLEVG